jgi:hypothetical protein
MISQEMELLLETVNYNVEGRQYVCAGHVSNHVSQTRFTSSNIRSASRPLDNGQSPRYSC